MKKFAILLASFALAFSAIALPAAVGAQSDVFGLQYGESTGLGNQDPRETAANIIRAGLGVLGIVAVVIVLWGGVLWMTAGGNDDRVQTAKKVLFSGMIGLIIIFSAFALTQFVVNQLLGATGFQS
jgi:hypothetical protein